MKISRHRTAFALALLAFGCVSPSGPSAPIRPAFQISPEAAAKECAFTLCREARNLEFALPRGKRTTIAVPHSPIVLGTEIATVFVGERIQLQVEFKPDGRAVLLALAEPNDPAKTVTLELRQETGRSLGIRLLVSSGLSAPLKMHLGMVLAGRDGVFETTSCAVYPGATGVEMWSDPIVEIVARDFRLLESGEAATCD